MGREGHVLHEFDGVEGKQKAVELHPVLRADLLPKVAALGVRLVLLDRPLCQLLPSSLRREIVGEGVVQPLCAVVIAVPTFELLCRPMCTL